MAEDFDSKEFWTGILDTRTERFAKLVKLHAPAHILCLDFILLMKTVASLYPEEFGKAYAESIVKASRIGMSLCAHCGKPHGQPFQEPWCPECEADAAVDVASAELEDSDDEG